MDKVFEGIADKKERKKFIVEIVIFANGISGTSTNIVPAGTIQDWICTVETMKEDTGRERRKR